MENGKLTEIQCPSCGGRLEIDKKNPNIEICRQCRQKYAVQWNRFQSTGKEELVLKPVPDRIAYEPVNKKEPRKTGWEPYGWKRGVALVILFFVAMTIMYGPKIYRRYQTDHGGITVESREK